MDKPTQISIMSPLRRKIVKAARNPRLAVYAVYVQMIRRAWRYFLAYRFDKAHHINTRQEVDKSRLDPINTNSLKHGLQYAPIPVTFLDLLLGYLKNESPDTYFVDIGCGKGLACFYAARKFKNIIGIDFSEKLIEQARQNQRSFINRNHSNIRFEVCDARSYRLVDQKAVVYMYNPFDAHILREFLNINMGHFMKHRSRIAYVNDECRDVLAEFGFREDFRNPSQKVSIYSLA